MKGLPGSDGECDFHAVRKTTASREIVAQFRDMISDGRLKVGDRLPPERELAQSFGIGRSTLREAVRVLESLGLVDVRPGEGTFLKSVPASRAHGHLPPEVFGQWTSPRDLFELRALLEPRLAGLAACRATADHLMKMGSVLDAQEARVRRGESGMDEDAAFRGLIAEATGNPTAVHLMETLNHLLQTTRDASLQHNGRLARSLRQNRAILEAIEAGNSTLAARRMLAHIRSLDRVLCTTELRSLEPLPPVRFGRNGPPSRSVVRRFFADSAQAGRPDLR